MNLTHRGKEGKAFRLLRSMRQIIVGTLDLLNDHVLENHLGIFQRGKPHHVQPAPRPDRNH